jgi:multiple sugar transport system ATP-binding protein
MADLTIDRLSKSFGRTQVLRNVSLAVRDGEFLSLLGPSGCGKSTLLRIIAGLETRDTGSIAIGGRNVDALRPKARDVAMVFQSYALYPHHTVERNMALPLRMRRLGRWQRLPLIGRLLAGSARIRAEIAAEVLGVARALEIEALLGRKPGQLSGGQRQRVALGRAMVRRPAVFLMDEPLSNLDAKLRAQMRVEIKELHQRLGATIVYVTHDQSEAMTMSDRIALMTAGEILQVGTPHDLYMSPVDRRVAEFVGSPRLNVLQATLAASGDVIVSGCRIGAIDHTGSDTGSDTGPARPVMLGIRPEVIGVTQPGVGRLTARVRLIEHLGSDVLVHAAIDAQAAPVIARIAAEPANTVSAGQAIGIDVPPGRILLFEANGRRLDARWHGTAQPRPLERVS